MTAQSAEAGTKASRQFVILNPASGTCSVEEVHGALERHFSCSNGSCRVHRMTGKENLEELARQAAEDGCEVVIAAGGDGTVSAVAGGLVGTNVPLGILPVGTGNILARELNVPIDLDAACALIAGPHRETPVDALKAEGRYFFTHVGVGVDALMIRDTSKEQKKRFGRLAYLWTALTQLMGFKAKRFTIRLEGQPVKRAHACEVLVANSRTLGQKPLTWGPHIRLDDGKADVCIVKAKTVMEYLKVTWAMLLGKHRESPIVSYLEATSTIEIDCSKSLPVQADGEIIGKTPVRVEVVSGALRVVTPDEVTESGPGASGR